MRGSYNTPDYSGQNLTMKTPLGATMSERMAAAARVADKAMVKGGAAVVNDRLADPFPAAIAAKEAARRAATAVIKGEIRSAAGPDVVRKLTERSPPRPYRGSPVSRTAEGLRDALFDEIERIRNTGDASRAKPIALLAGQIIAAARLELEAITGDGAKTVGVRQMKLGRSAVTEAGVEKP